MMKGIKFGDVHSYDDLNLVLSEVSIPPAIAKTNFVDIPGGDGSVDLTEALGEVKYKDREGVKFTFTVFPYEDFEQKKKQVSNLLNGKRCRITVDKDPDYYWVGRCSVDEYASNKNLHKIIVGATVAPYKFKNDMTRVFVPFSGKNLFDNTATDPLIYYRCSIQSIDTGVRCTVTNAGESSYVILRLLPVSMLAGKKLTLRANFAPSGKNIPRCRLVYSSADGSQRWGMATLNESGKSASFTVSETHNGRAWDYVDIQFNADLQGQDVVGDYVDFTNVQVEISDTATEYERYTPVTEAQEIILSNSRKSVCPNIVCTGEVKVSFAGGETTLNAGSHKILDLQLQEGETTVTVNGTGAVAFVYQEGDL